MGLHDLVLLGRQAAGFVENGVGNGNLAHVVHDGRQGDVLDLLLAEAVPKAGAAQKQPRDVVNAVDVLARFAAAELDGCGQGLDHAPVQVHDGLGLAADLLFLALHHVGQCPPVLEQLHHRVHPPGDDVGNHRLFNHVHHAQAVGLPADLGRFGCDEKHRGPPVRRKGRVDPAQHLHAVHHGHLHVQKHGAHLAAVLFQQAQALAPSPASRMK